LNFFQTRVHLLDEAQQALVTYMRGQFRIYEATVLLELGRPADAIVPLSLTGGPVLRGPALQASPQAHYLLGKALFQLGRIEEALMALIPDGKMKAMVRNVPGTSQLLHSIRQHFSGKRSTHEALNTVPHAATALIGIAVAAQLQVSAWMPWALFGITLAVVAAVILPEFRTRGTHDGIIGASA